MCLTPLSKRFLNSVTPGAVTTRKPVLVLSRPLHDEPFPYIQAKPSVTQLQAIPFSPVSGHKSEDVSVCHSSSPQKEVVDFNVVTPPG